MVIVFHEFDDNPPASDCPNDPDLDAPALGKSALNELLMIHSLEKSGSEASLKGLGRDRAPARVRWNSQCARAALMAAR